MAVPGSPNQTDKDLASIAEARACARVARQAQPRLAELSQEQIDAIVNRYYYEIVGSFWPPERGLVEKFDQLPFPFPEIAVPSFEMSLQWNLAELMGYLRTWSATQRYIAANNLDPVQEIEQDLRVVWGEPDQQRQVAWPLTLRVGQR